MEWVVHLKSKCPRIWRRLVHWRETLSIPPRLQLTAVRATSRWLALLVGVSDPVPELHAAKALLTDTALVAYLCTADVVARLQDTRIDLNHGMSSPGAGWHCVIAIQARHVVTNGRSRHRHWWQIRQAAGCKLGAANLLSTALSDHASLLVSHRN